MRMFYCEKSYRRIGNRIVTDTVDAPLQINRFRTIRPMRTRGRLPLDFQRRAGGVCSALVRGVQRACSSIELLPRRYTPGLVRSASSTVLNVHSIKRVARSLGTNQRRMPIVRTITV